MIKLLFDRELGKANLTEDYNRLCEKLIFCEEFNKETLIPLPDIRCTFSLCISNDGNYLAAMHGNHSVSIIDVRINKLSLTLEGHPRSVWCGCFNPVNSNMLVTGCLGGHLIIWKLTYGNEPSYEQRNNFKVAETTAISSIVFHNAGQLFFFSSDCYIYIWRDTEPQPRICNNFSTKIKYLHLLPDSYYIIVGHELPFRIDYTDTMDELRNTLNDVREEMRDFVMSALRISRLDSSWVRFMPDTNLLRPDDVSRSHLNPHDLTNVPRNTTNVIESVKFHLHVTLSAISNDINVYKSEYQNVNHVSYDDQPNISRLIGIASRQYDDLRIENDNAVFLNYIANVLHKVSSVLTFESEPQISDVIKFTFSLLFNDVVAFDFLRVCHILIHPPTGTDYLKLAEVILIFLILKALIPAMLRYIQIYWETAMNRTGFYVPRANIMRMIQRTDPSTSFLKLAQIKAFAFDPITTFQIFTNFEFYPILYHRAIGVYSLNEDTFGLLMYTFQVDYTSTIALALSPLHNHLVVASRRRNSNDGNSIFLFEIGLDHFVAHGFTKFKSKINCMVFLNNLQNGIAIGLDGGDGIFRRNRTLH